jgi:CHAT domain-containing protein/tetratricopeptide (TPR) repeat protein
MVEPLLALTDAAERQQWIQTQLPQKDHDFLQALSAEAERRERENPQSALPVAEVLAELAQAWGDRECTALAALHEASTCRLLGEPQRARHLYSQAFAQYQALGLTDQALRAITGQLEVMLALGEVQQARQVADEAIAQLHPTAEGLRLARLLVNRGNICARLGEYRAARQDYSAARTRFAAAAAHADQALVMANEANLLTSLHDFRQAEELYRQARAYFVEANWRNAVGQVDHNLAYLAFAQGDYQQALSTYNTARTLFVEQQSTLDVHYVDLYRSEVYLALNLWQEALDLVRGARPGFEQAGMIWEVGQLWLNEAVALTHSVLPDAAKVAIDAARQCFTQENNTLWLAIVDLYHATFELRWQAYSSGQLAAQNANARFRELGVPNRLAESELLLGEFALAQNAPTVAEQHFRQVLAEPATADLPAVRYRAHFGLGRLYRQRGQLGEAQLALQAAIQDIERLQAAIGAEDYKIAFRSDKLQVYEALILLCMDRPGVAAQQLAFETVERAKARAFLDALMRMPATRTVGAVQAELQTEMDALRRELNWLYNRLNAPDQSHERRTSQQLAELSQAITERERALQALLTRWRAPELAAVLENPVMTVELSQFQAALPPETLLLEYYMAPKQIYVFGLTAERLWVATLAVTHEQIYELVGQLRFQMSKFSFGPVYRTRHAQAMLQSTLDCLQRLHGLLLAPLADRLTSELVIVVPHQLLHYVPFHALYDGARYVIEEQAIAYAPSATLLHRLFTANQSPNSTEPPLIFGIADATIPYAQVEAETLGTLFPTAQLYVGEAATVGQLLTPALNPLFLHLSTHATFRTDNPYFSALKLADGWVTVMDIATLPSCPALVTLSACETGRSRVYAGDELIGLCRSFFTVGARALVVSQWTVEDLSTTQLMAHFYHALANGVAFHQALRTAQLRTLAEYKHPYFWAAFQLTGDPTLRLPLLTNADAEFNHLS